MLTKEQNELIEKHMPLAYNRANKMYRRYTYRLAQINVDLEDVQGQAMLGLIRAVQKFDKSHGCKLSTYATIYIDNYTKRYILENNCMLKIPRYSNLNLNVHKKNVDFLRTCISGGNILNLEKPVFNPTGSKEMFLADIIEDENYNMLMAEILILIDQVLTDKEFKIFYDYFVLDKYQKEIGDDVKMHQVHVSRILKKAKIKVKEALESKV